MVDDTDSELSSLSSLSPAPLDEESDVELKKKGGILQFFHKIPRDREQAMKKPKKDMSPPLPKRESSPEHVYVFADNPDIAFLVMFRKRFDSALPKSLPHFGPLELEQDIVQHPPGERVELFLCAILGLLLNRKQDVKIGHYERALNDFAINGKDFKDQWPRKWGGKSLLAGDTTFHSLTPEQRLDLLRTLIYWTLGHSDAVKSIINASYNQKRTNDDLNQPLSVQPWGSDSDKRRYFLVEGDNDSSFRVYRESNPAGFNRKWINVAGSIDEVKALAEKLQTADGGPNARRLSSNILKNIPNFEEKEEKRRKREYRRLQKERFRRPEPGLSLYEGRTRGKRAKYTYDDEEDFYTDSTNNRRSARNTRNPTPTETGPVITASGRQSRPPARLNAETLSNAGSVQGDASTAHDEIVMDINGANGAEFRPTGRPKRSAAINHGTDGWANPKKRRRDYISDDEEDDSEPDLGDDDEEADIPDETDDDKEEFEAHSMDTEDEIVTDSPRSTGSRVVKLKIKVKFDKRGKATRLQTGDSTPSATSPSNIASSASSPDSASEGSPIPSLEPEKIGDSVNVAAFKRATPEPRLAAVAGAPVLPPPSSVDSVSTARASTGLVSATPAFTAPTSTAPVSAAALAFRGSPEKPQATRPFVSVENGE